MNDVFRGLGVQVELRDRQAFLIIVETLTRMGIPSARSNVLYQSAHLLHKRGLYAIMHFKELFQLDGKASTLTTEDVERRNAIAMLLEEWGLLTIVFPERVVSRAPPGSEVDNGVGS